MKPDPSETALDPVKQAASLMGQRSAAARRKKWGEAEFVKKMQEWGKLGGRPPKKGKTERESTNSKRLKSSKNRR